MRDFTTCPLYEVDTPARQVCHALLAQAARLWRLEDDWVDGDPYSTCENQFMWAAENAFWSAPGPPRTLEQRQYTITDPLPMRGEHVYRLYDPLGDLLYVGLSGDVRGRVRAHMRSQAWGAHIYRVECDEYPSRDAAGHAEAAAIATLGPLHNVQGRQR